MRNEFGNPRHFEKKAVPQTPTEGLFPHHALPSQIFLEKGETNPFGQFFSAEKGSQVFDLPRMATGDEIPQNGVYREGKEKPAHEATSGGDRSIRRGVSSSFTDIIVENSVTDMVIRAVSSFEELNAPTREEGDKKFTQALISTIERRKVSTKIGNGELFVVNPLRNTENNGNENVVVKRFRAGDSYLKNKWESVRKEHKLVEKYFGRRFVPYTEFIETRTNFGDSEPQDSLILPGHEYVMVQELITGEEFTGYERGTYSSIETSPELKSELNEFIRRYETMMRREQKVIPEQIAIDYQTNKIHVLDTNLLYSMDLQIELAKYTLQAWSIAPESIRNSNDALKALFDHIPQLALLKDKSYSEIVNSELWETFKRDRPFFKSAGDAGIINGIDELIRMIEEYAPEGGHNNFVRRLMSKFGINEEELA